MAGGVPQRATPPSTVRLVLCDIPHQPMFCIRVRGGTRLGSRTGGSGLGLGAADPAVADVVLDSVRALLGCAVGGGGEPRVWSHDDDPECACGAKPKARTITRHRGGRGAPADSVQRIRPGSVMTARWVPPPRKGRGSERSK
jgi:hypothetical protein